MATVSGAELAFKDGQAARTEGKPRSVPSGYRTAKGLQRAWEKGWDDGARFVPEPHIASRDPIIITREEMWPEGEPFPTVYRVPRPSPCPKCKRVRLKTGHQAVICRNIQRDAAYLWCRGCGNQFKMGVAR